MLLKMLRREYAIGVCVDIGQILLLVLSELLCIWKGISFAILPMVIFMVLVIFQLIYAYLLRKGKKEVRKKFGTYENLLDRTLEKFFMENQANEEIFQWDSITNIQYEKGDNRWLYYFVEKYQELFDEDKNDIFFVAAILMDSLIRYPKISVKQGIYIENIICNTFIQDVVKTFIAQYEKYLQIEQKGDFDWEILVEVAYDMNKAYRRYELAWLLQQAYESKKA